MGLNKLMEDNKAKIDSIAVFADSIDTISNSLPEDISDEDRDHVVDTLNLLSDILDVPNVNIYHNGIHIKYYVSKSMRPKTVKIIPVYTDSLLNFSYPNTQLA